eukprot:3454421-Heterocapsa_arctica.AAC.1
MVESLLRVSPACLMVVVCAIHASSWGRDGATVVQVPGPAVGKKPKVVQGVTHPYVYAHGA